MSTPLTAADLERESEVLAAIIRADTAELSPSQARVLACREHIFTGELRQIADAVQAVRDEGQDPVNAVTLGRRLHGDTLFALSSILGKVENTLSDWIMEQEAAELLKSVPDEVLAKVRIEAPETSCSMSFADGLAYDIGHDPNTLLGMVNGKTTRYLCRGKASFIIAPSGIGKSVLLLQGGCLFTLGLPLFGITPVKPLRVLMVQGENDDADLAEMIQGAAAALGIDEMSPEVETLTNNLRIISDVRSTGRDFCRRLGREIERFSADLALVDPLLSFAGIDVSRQDQCSTFLRGWLNPVLADTGAGLIAAHHTGKPKAPKDVRGMTPIDYAYAGLGSSELVNWARAISVIIPHGDCYELKLLKRGSRAGAVHPNGEPTNSVWMRHAEGKLWWEQLNSPVEPELEQAAAGGRPSKVEEVLAIGLGTLIDALTEPVSKNEVARQIEAYAAKAKLDISTTTAKQVVEKLVANGAIKKEEGKYVKA